MASGGSCEDPLKGYQLGGHRLYDERQGTLWEKELTKEGKITMSAKTVEVTTVIPRASSATEKGSWPRVISWKAM